MHANNIFTFIAQAACYLSWCMLLLHPANAQPALRFKRIGVEDGLAHNTVLTILQDRKGFMWFGTQDGLCRYDGYEFTVFRHQDADPTSLSSNKVNVIVEDREGYIWVGTQTAGLNRYNPATETFTRFLIDTVNSSSHMPVWVSDLLEDKQGNIWGTTFGQGLFRYDKTRNKFDHFIHHPGDENSLGSNTLNSLAVDAQGNIWIAAIGVLHRYNPQTRTFRQYKGGPVQAFDFNSEYLTHLFFDKAGMLWIGTQNSGRLQFDPVRETVIQFQHIPSDPASISSNFTYFDGSDGIYEDRTGKLWMSTNGGGLNIFDQVSGTFSHYTNDPSNQYSVSSNILSAIYEDDHGNVWIGSESGISVCSPFEKPFTLYQQSASHPNGLSDNNIVSLLEDHEGILWIGTKSGGLNRYDRKTNTYKAYRYVPNQPGSLSGDMIQSMYEDRKGDLWVGSIGGLNRFDRKTESFTRFHHSIYWEMLADIHAIFEDQSGNFWLGTHTGLFSFNRKTGEAIPYFHDPGIPESISNNTIGRIFQDSRGVIWVSTWIGGLNRMKPRKNGEPPAFIHFQHNPDHPQSLSSNEVSVLFEDSKGRLWIGTADGLNVYEPESDMFRRFGKEAGFLSTFIYGILEDTKGYLWISTGNGLCRFDPQTGKVKVYDEEDGLQSNSFSGQFQLGAHCKSHTGEMFFGGPNGFNSFFPNQIQDNKHVPPVVVTTVKVFDTPLQLSEPISKIRKIEIPYSDNVFSLHFSALDFRNPSKNRYSYQLEGFSKKWVEAGTNHLVTYTNLPPGTYTFQVKGTNNDGIWNRQGASLTISILPPWWRTWWAYVVYVLVCIGSIWGFIAYRSRKLQTENRMLENKVSQRTAEVVAQKEELQTILEDLQATQVQLIQKEKMASLGELTAGIAHEIQNPLNFVNNFSEVSQELCEEIVQEAKTGHPEEVLAITSDLKQNLAKIHHHGKRADSIVKNMLQHSRASSGEKQLTDINALVEEYLRLAYHGLRAKEKDFNAELITDFDSSLSKVEVVPQEIGRVLLNLFNNAFYATQLKKVQLNGQYQPQVIVTTKALKEKVEIRVKDNGTGIPEGVKSKIFQPFFTTKPTGQGTGLGLSLSYDIITKGHRGELKVESKEGEYSEFIVSLPI
jgi:ligand-binding sensor domain-containing protein/signal transduction histidine kinase